jgi:hypothetical protein
MTEEAWYDKDEDPCYEMAKVNAGLRQKLANILEFCNTLRGKGPWSEQMARWFRFAELGDEPRQQYTIVWDGEPSMSGQPHRQQMGMFNDLDAARAGRDLVLGRSVHAPKPNLRIEMRYVSSWEIVE